MKLAKWQGLGNDYLIVEPAVLPGPLTSQAIALLCHRHLGVGADGILVHDVPTGAIPGAVARMRIFNPDGSEPEMCGNGIRMFARYLARSGVVPAVAGTEFAVETLAGEIKPRLLPDGRVRVDMGVARFNSANLAASALSGTARATSVIETGADAGDRVEAAADAVDIPLEAGGRSFRFTFVDVGNPHCVILVDDPAGFDVESIGPVIERHPFFPNRANVEFVRREPDGSVRMRVWERGVGETQACGTGATAVGAAMVRLGLATSPVLVHLLGGDLTIEVEPREAGATTAASTARPGIERADGGAVTGYRVFMTGPAEEVFCCDLSPDLLDRLGWPAAADH